MSAAIERGLISSVIKSGNLTEVLDARISENFFEDDEHRQVWVWLLEHWTEHGQVPDRTTLRRNYPQWKLAATPEPISYYIEEIRDARRRSIATEALLHATDLVQDDTVAAIKVLSLAIQEANAEVSSLKTDVLTQEGERRMELYREIAKNPGKLRGMATGYQAIDRATRGVQPEQYIVIAGPPKAAKSTLLMAIGIHMNVHENASVLMLSFEMSREEQAARHDAMRAHVNYNKLMLGQLDPKEMRRLERANRNQKDYNDFTMSTDISAMTTVSGVRALVEQMKPDVVMIDGIYLMEDEHDEQPGSPRALTNISRGIKRMAQATRIPVIATTQALESKIQKRSGMTSSSVGYTSAFGQDCDVLLGIERDPEIKGMSLLRVLLSRSGPLAAVNLEIDWETSSITEHPLDFDRTTDEPEEDADAEAAPRSRRSRF